MSFIVENKRYGNENHTWIHSKYGTSECRTVTLDAKAFATYAPNKEIPSGIALEKDPTTGKYKPATSDAKVEGFLFTSQQFNGTDVIAPMLDHGRIIVENLPEQSALKFDATFTNPHFLLVDRRTTSS